MRALKWIFQPASLLVIVVAVVIYLNRSTLFPNLEESSDIEATAGKVESLIASLQSATSNGMDAEKEKRESDGAESIVAMHMDGDTSDNEETTNTDESLPPPEQTPPLLTDNAELPPATPAQEQSTESSGTTQSGSAEAEAVSPVEDVAPDSKEMPNVEQAAHEADEPMAVAPVPVMPEAEDENTAQDSGASESSVPAVTPAQLQRTMQQARMAAWHGEFATAIEYYQTVITLQPSNYDAYGEMGNVMLQIGDRDGAAEAYYQAARLLNHTPQRWKAWQLLDVIAWLSPAKAQRLYQELIQP